MKATETVAARHYATGEAFAFRVQGDRLLGRQPTSARTDLLFGPGFLDLQCNGYAGVDFNDPNAAPGEIQRAIRAMWQHGCTDVLPTVITHTPERIGHLLGNLSAAVAGAPYVAASVPGFHLEGPFLSPVEGARGAHPLSAISPVRLPWWRRWQKAAGGRIRMVTVAPEVKGALPFIMQLRGEGVVPAIGHTMASAAEVGAAAERGALLSTHLGNGCPQQMHRHENPVLAQAGEDRLWASLITDGIHLPPGVVRTFYRAKGGRAVAVTDAMSAAGAPPGRYRLADLELEVGADRVVRFPGAANFAGSALTMDRAVAGLKTMAGLSWAEAWEASSLRPWQILRQANPALRPRPLATSFVIARPGSAGLEIRLTVRDRQVLWRG